MGGWRKLHNEELHNFYSSQHVITAIKLKRMRSHRTHVKMNNAYEILVGKPEGMRPLGRSKHRRESIRLDLKKKTGSESADWIHLVQKRD
jgi:hypothetical protein